MLLVFRSNAQNTAKGFKANVQMIKGLPVSFLMASWGQLFGALYGAQTFC